MGLTERSFLERMELMGFTAEKPITNADRIRSMSDEELAELFMQEYDGADSFTCPVPHPCPPEKEASCRECFLDWLKEDAD